MNHQELSVLLSSGQHTRTLFEALKSQEKKKDLGKWAKQYDPMSHEVMNTVFRPKKKVKTDQGEAWEDVTRIAIPFQQDIVEKAVSFTFGTPPILNSEPKTDAETALLNAVKRVMFENKIDSFNRALARELFRSTEVAEYWFTTTSDKPHRSYGFPTRLRLRSMLFSSWKGDSLYPLYDDFGDMIAFSRGYEKEDIDGRQVYHFETYTADFICRWKKTGAGDWDLTERLANPIGKIPIIYGRQETPEWYPVQSMIDRLETMESNLGDTNEYHAAPKILVTGDIKGWAKKGEQGQVIQADQGATADYLSWDNSPESLKLEFMNLTRFIYTFSQTPDISFESLRGIGQIATETLKLLFLDAHLKVQRKREILDAYLQRRVNLVQSYLAILNPAYGNTSESFEMVPEIQPFTIASQKDLVDLLMRANGNKPLVSHKTSVIQAGMVTDAEAEYQTIIQEVERTNLLELTEPTT